MKTKTPTKKTSSPSMSSSPKKSTVSSYAPRKTATAKPSATEKANETSYVKNLNENRNFIAKQHKLQDAKGYLPRVSIKPVEFKSKPTKK